MASDQCQLLTCNGPVAKRSITTVEREKMPCVLCAPRRRLRSASTSYCLMARLYMAQEAKLRPSVPEICCFLTACRLHVCFFGFVVFLWYCFEHIIAHPSDHAASKQRIIKVDAKLERRANIISTLIYRIVFAEIIPFVIKNETGLLSCAVLN